MFAPAISLADMERVMVMPMPDPIGSAILLTPAYGRTYLTAVAMLADWDDGKDFKMYGCGAYCSIRDIAALMQGTSRLSLFQASPMLNVLLAGFV